MTISPKRFKEMCTVGCNAIDFDALKAAFARTDDAHDHIAIVSGLLTAAHGFSTGSLGKERTEQLWYDTALLIKLMKDKR